MQPKAPADEFYSINQLNTAISNIKKVNPTIREEEIAKELGYNETFISQTRSRGKVSKKFMDNLNRYVSTLQNVKKVEDAAQATHLPDEESQTVKSLADSTKDLSLANLIHARNIERLIGLLEIKFYNGNIPMPERKTETKIPDAYKQKSPEGL